MTPKEKMYAWLRDHGVRPKFENWCIFHCVSMAEVWDTAKPDWLVWVATRDGVLSDRDVRLFACWCARQVWHLLTDESSRVAVEVAERFARGEATQEELDAAWTAAWDASRTIPSLAAVTAAWKYVWIAWTDWAAWNVATNALGPAARDAQAAYIRATYPNPFVEAGQ